MDQARYLIPRHLDDPPMLFIWEGDTAGIFMLPFMLGYYMSSIYTLAVGVIVGVIVAKWYANIKSDGGTGLILHWLYWYTPAVFWSKWIHVPSDVREYHG